MRLTMRLTIASEVGATLSNDSYYCEMRYARIEHPIIRRDI